MELIIEFIIFITKMNVSFGLSFCKTHSSEISGQISNILPQSVFFLLTENV